VEDIHLGEITVADVERVLLQTTSRTGAAAARAVNDVRAKPPSVAHDRFWRGLVRDWSRDRSEAVTRRSRAGDLSTRAGKRYTAAQVLRSRRAPDSAVGCETWPRRAKIRPPLNHLSITRFPTASTWMPLVLVRSVLQLLSRRWSARPEHFIASPCALSRSTRAVAAHRESWHAYCCHLKSPEETRSSRTVPREFGYESGCNANG
jgi:hypothetical protein